MQGATDILAYIPRGQEFQSTPPMQGATVLIYQQFADKVFQSTPPMQGATRAGRQTLILRSSFNPRPLCRERPAPPDAFMWMLLFQSTPPMQGATIECFKTAESHREFQSTPPMQGATAISAKNSSSFSAEIDKLSFQILKFPLFSSPLRLQNTPFVHI